MDEPIPAVPEPVVEVPTEASPAPEPIAEIPATPEETPPQPQAPEAPAANAAPSVEVLALEPTVAPARAVSTAFRGEEGRRKSGQVQKQKIAHHLEKILTAASARGRITNRDIVTLLKVSDATASRYLRLLVSRGQLKKEGRGRSVLYTSL